MHVLTSPGPPQDFMPGRAPILGLPGEHERLVVPPHEAPPQACAKVLCPRSGASGSVMQDAFLGVMGGVMGMTTPHNGLSTNSL